MKKQILGSLAIISMVVQPLAAYAQTINAGGLQPSVSIGGYTASATLNQVSTFLANQLAHNRNLKNVSDSRVAIASFVGMHNLEETDRLGMALAENMMHEMHVRGFGVVDFKTRDNIKVRPNGDFVFSRDVQQLRQQYNIHYFLSGTINRNADGAVINARMVQADTGTIVSTAQSFISNRDLQRILSDGIPAVEKIVIERPIVPPVRQYTVNLR